ncbi:hypothetical protein KHP62_07650 [Rhodobacteraceae bacterium NNCM2]|nr:hypothetical protein [Coraliihabitans acroporae]
MTRLIPMLLVLLLPLQAVAGEALDLMFYTKHFEKTDPAAELRYTHTRTTALQDRLGPDTESVIAVKREPSGTTSETIITLDADTAPRRLDTFRDVPGNPILMVFMETVVSSVSAATGGSPFYIRNRIKESFARGTVAQEGADKRIVFTPFENDKNRARMGPFADLEIEMTMDADRPGMFGSLHAHAETPEATIYSEEMRYVETR